MQMKTIGATLAVVVLCTIALASIGITESFAQEQEFMATLSGHEEVPPTESQAMLHDVTLVR